VRESRENDLRMEGSGIRSLQGRKLFLRIGIYKDATPSESDGHVSVIPSALPVRLRRMTGVTRGNTEVNVTILSASTALADCRQSLRQNRQLDLRSSLCGYTIQFRDVLFVAFSPFESASWRILRGGLFRRESKENNNRGEDYSIRLGVKRLFEIWTMKGDETSPRRDSTTTPKIPPTVSCPKPSDFHLRI